MTDADLAALIALAETPGPESEDAARVLADQLSAMGDPRGELIVLDSLDRAGRLDRPDQLERLLLLAAEYTFPWRGPEPATHPWRRGELVTLCDEFFSLTYEVDFKGRVYEFQFKRGGIYVGVEGDGAMVRDSPETADSLEPASIDHDENLVTEAFLGERLDLCWWSEEETATCMPALCDWLQHEIPINALAPPYESMRSRPAPRYAAGPLRVAWLPWRFCQARGISDTRYALAGRDYHRWVATFRRLEALVKG